MRTLLNHCAGLPLQPFSAGDVLLREAETSGRLYILSAGTVEVLRGETSVVTVVEPGAVFGEMSILLNRPHTATVRALTAVEAYVVEDAGALLASRPEIALLIATLLAQRLNAATTYLVDIKRQFAGHDNHFAMVGEVLESLMHHQEEPLNPGSERQPEPFM